MVHKDLDLSCIQLYYNETESYNITSFFDRIDGVQKQLAVVAITVGEKRNNKIKTLVTYWKTIDNDIHKVVINSDKDQVINVLSQLGYPPAIVYTRELKVNSLLNEN